MSIDNLLQTIGFPMESIRTKQTAIKEIRDSAELLKDYGITYEPKTKLIYRKASFDNSITFMSTPNKTKELPGLSDE
jgi:SET domain-containing protein